MCGYAGFWEFKPVTGATGVLQNMGDAIANRGPDCDGVWSNNHLGLGIIHKRLSILDLSKLGKQPMVSASGRFVIAYNGEIYNAFELKKELKLETKSNTDTEVLLEACEILGVKKAISKCVGMFSFALFDNLEHKLYLVRDRIGIKPCYFGFNNNILFFGSEIKSFFHHPKWNIDINLNAVSNFLSFNYIPGKESIINNINKLEPGTIATILSDKKCIIEKYWNFDDVANQLRTDIPIEDYITGLEKKIRQAVSRRLISDVPLGAFLSGGIDSSLVVALMQAESSSAVKTFTIGFKENSFNEAIYAKEIANHLGTEHHEYYLSEKEAQDIVYDLPTFYDEPFADSSQIPTYLVSKIAKKHVTVALSGDGGDELFAGYNRYILVHRIWKYLRFMPKFSQNIFAKLIKVLSPETWNKFPSKIPQLGDKLYKFADILNEKDIINFYKKIITLWPNSKEMLLNQDLISGYNYPDVKNLPLISKLQYLDTKMYLPDDILTKVDRASMAVSLEARVPLLDHNVVEYAWQLPEKYKIYNKQAKWPLYKILEKYVPKELIDRPKMGFGIPIANWFRKDLKELLLDYVNEEAINKVGILDYKKIKPRIEQHLKGTHNWHYSLWGVLMLQMWCDRYLNIKVKDKRVAS